MDRKAPPSAGWWLPRLCASTASLSETPDSSSVASSWNATTSSCGRSRRRSPERAASRRSATSTTVLPSAPSLRTSSVTEPAFACPFTVRPSGPTASYSNSCIAGHSASMSRDTSSSVVCPWDALMRPSCSRVRWPWSPASFFRSVRLAPATIRSCISSDTGTSS